MNRATCCLLLPMVHLDYWCPSIGAHPMGAPTRRHKWVRAGSTSFELEPRKLMPALMRYNAATKGGSSGGASGAHLAPNQPDQALRFLQHCVKNLKNRDPVVTKHLVSLLANSQVNLPLPLSPLALTTGPFVKLQVSRHAKIWE